MTNGAEQDPGRRGREDRPEVPLPEGKALGVPYDLRRPTVQRFRSRTWNPADRRIFTPKTFGWGFELNIYWLAHPLRFLRTRRTHAS